jgi:hypothetical protein
VIEKLTPDLSQKLAIKLAIDDVSRGPDPSLGVSTPKEGKTKKAQEIPGFVALCHLLSSGGFSLRMGEEGSEQLAVSLGFCDLDPTLAQKLAQCTAKMDIQSIFETLGDKERIEAVLFLKQLRERSMLRQ